MLFVAKLLSKKLTKYDFYTLSFYKWNDLRFIISGLYLND